MPTLGLQEEIGTNQSDSWIPARLNLKYIWQDFFSGAFRFHVWIVHDNSYISRMSSRWNKSVGLQHFIGYQMSSYQVQHQRQVQEVEKWWRAKAEEEQRVLYARICELEQMLLMSRAGGDCFVWRAWLLSAAPGHLGAQSQRPFFFQPGTLIREVAKQHGVFKWRHTDKLQSQFWWWCTRNIGLPPRRLAPESFGGNCLSSCNSPFRG